MGGQRPGVTKTALLRVLRHCLQGPGGQGRIYPFEESSHSGPLRARQPSPRQDRTNQVGPEVDDLESVAADSAIAGRPAVAMEVRPCYFGLLTLKSSKNTTSGSRLPFQNRIVSKPAFLAALC